VKNWGNTVEALRQKRMDDKIKKLEEDEVVFLIFRNIKYR
jgi:hypothetical protein